MSERKDINKLFQEKFELFEVTPNEMVWNNIEKELKEKKKRRVIPIWWKLSGIAAAFLVGFFAYTHFKTPSSVENGFVNQETKENEAPANKLPKTNTAVATTNGIHNASKDTNKGITNVSKGLENTNNGSIPTSINGIESKKEVSNNRSKTNTSLVNAENTSIKAKSDILKETHSSVIENHEEEKVAFHTVKHKKANHKNSMGRIENNSSLAVQSENEKETSTNVLSSDKAPNNVANLTIDKNKSNVIPNNGLINQTTNKKIDSSKIAIVEPNALEELLNEKESKSITEPKLNRWQVSSNVAPIYFSSISNGSPLDNSLKNNDKSYAANNQSYGIGVNYAVNKKLRLRTGVNILNVDYNTNGIIYYQTQSVSGKLANMTPTLIGSTIMIENLSNVDMPFNKMIQKSEGSLNQKLGYIEMPLEISYKILDKKFGIDFIGGMSTMILNRNEIYLQSSELNLKIGEANNLNNVHFSGNVGIGFKYDIFRRLEARIEPVFKYQINTFNNDAGNFKPYVFGVYSGINFTF